LLVKGIVTSKGPRVQAELSVRGLGASKLIWFTVDTGANFSSISEAEAILMGIDCSTLPSATIEAVGFGGFFRPRVLNREVDLTFPTESGEYRLQRSGFMVTCPPDSVRGKERDRIVEITPSVLGMDVLSHFDLHVYKKRVELVPRDTA
jgi:hypothetical protein